MWLALSVRMSLLNHGLKQGLHLNCQQLNKVCMIHKRLACHFCLWSSNDSPLPPEVLKVVLYETPRQPLQQSSNTSYAMKEVHEA